MSTTKLTWKQDALRDSSYVAQRANLSTRRMDYFRVALVNSRTRTWAAFVNGKSLGTTDSKGNAKLIIQEHVDREHALYWGTAV